MSKLTATQWRELRTNFNRAHDTKNGSTDECDSCGRSIKSFKQWFNRASYEYDEWNLYCPRCALREIHLYDDFDDEAFAAIMNFGAGQPTNEGDSDGEQTEGTDGAETAVAGGA